MDTLEFSERLSRCEGLPQSKSHLESKFEAVKDKTEGMDFWDVLENLLETCSYSHEHVSGEGSGHPFAG